MCYIDEIMLLRLKKQEVASMLGIFQDRCIIKDENIQGLVILVLITVQCQGPVSIHPLN